MDQHHKAIRVQFAMGWVPVHSYKLMLTRDPSGKRSKKGSVRDHTAVLFRMPGLVITSVSGLHII